MPQRRVVVQSPPRSAFRAELKAEKVKPVAEHRAEEDVTRLLHAEVKAHGPRLTVGSSAFLIIVLGIVVIGGIAAIMWLRDFAETAGVNWH